MKTFSRTCPVCASVFEVNINRLKFAPQATCSRDCSYKIRCAGMRKAELVSCSSCGKQVMRPPSQQKAKHGASYCSRACHYAGRSAGMTKRIVTKPYQYTEEAKAALIASSCRPRGQRRFHPTTCTNCGITFDDKSDGRERKSGLCFCTLACCNSFRKGKHNPAWRGGHPKYYGPDWSRVRREARERDNHTCRRCGRNPKPRRPDVHHIRPVGSFADPNEAHFLANVISLCHPCHMFVEWNGMDFEV